MKWIDTGGHVKAIGQDDGLDDGQFTAIVAVFNNVDLGGDVIRPGAFTESLAAWAASGDPIPVIWSHQWNDIDAHIGAVVSAQETSEGLLVTAQLDLDSPDAQQAFKLLKERRVKEFSFGYDIVDGGYVTVDGVEVFELRKLNLIEVGPTLKGMNPLTRLLGTKSAEDADAEIRKIVREELAAKAPHGAEGVEDDDSPPDKQEPSGVEPDDSPPSGGTDESPSKSAGFSYAQIAAWATAEALVQETSHE